MKLFDLSHRLFDGMVTHPSHPRVIINDFVVHDFSAPRYQPPCKGFATKQLLISDHAGTHVDAPSHFYKDGEAIAEQPLEKYYGPALLLDVSRKDLRRPVDRELVEETLELDGLEIQDGDIVLIRAWAGDWRDPDFHRANGLAIDAAQWLCAKGIKAVGIDLSNIEDNPDMTRKVHMFLLGEKLPVYENLANLDRLPVKRFIFAGIPLNLEGCTGSPVRAMAIVEH